MNWSIDFAPMLPPPLFWAAVALAVVLVALLFSAARAARCSAPRALAALLLALANPTLARGGAREPRQHRHRRHRREHQPDCSPARPAQAAAIRADIEAKLGKIPGLQVKWVAVAKPDGETHVRHQPVRRPQQGAGQHAAGPAGRRHHDHRRPGARRAEVRRRPRLRRAGACAADRPPDEFDRRIEVIKAPKFGIVGQTRDIEVAVREMGQRRPSRQRGHAAGPPRGPARRDASAPRSAARCAIADAVPARRPEHPRDRARAAPGELTPANNRAVVAAEGVRENLRVLLVSGEPHAGERTWRNLLKSDAAVDLVHFTILRPPEKQDGTPINQLSLIAFPTRELFSREDQRVRPDHLRPLPAPRHPAAALLRQHRPLRERARRRAAGRRRRRLCRRVQPVRTPLSPVLPALPTGRVLEQPFKAKITDDGAKHPVTREPARLPATRRGADLGPLVPPGRRATRPRPHRHERRRGQAAAGARPQGQGPGRAADLRPRLAVGARLSRAAGRIPTCCAGCRTG